MSEEFHDWLDKCPVMWLRDRVDRDHVFYAFETPNEEDDAIILLKAEAIKDNFIAINMHKQIEKFNLG